MCMHFIYLFIHFFLLLVCCFCLTFKFHKLLSIMNSFRSGVNNIQTKCLSFYMNHKKRSGWKTRAQRQPDIKTILVINMGDFSCFCLLFTVQLLQLLLRRYLFYHYLFVAVVFLGDSLLISVCFGRHFDQRLHQIGTTNPNAV